MTTTISKEYRDLIERFPLRPIHDATQYAEAAALMRELALKSESRTPDETAYQIVLSKLIHDYEAALPEVQALLAEAAAVSPAELLTFLVEEHALSLRELARQIDCDQGNLTAFLTGRRGLSKAVARKLADRFKVSIDLFLP
jgi:HTH-type transcriptional regulator / antitoxin HigA